MTSPQDEETKMVKEKAGEEVSVKVEIPPVITKEKQERPGTESKQEQQYKRRWRSIMDWKKLVSKFGGKMTREKWLFLLLLGVILMILSMPFPGSSSKRQVRRRGKCFTLGENSSGDGQQTEET